jgi:hypothetical protein
VKQIDSLRRREKTLDYGDGWFIVADTKVRERIGQPNYSGVATIIPFLGIVRI